MRAAKLAVSGKRMHAAALVVVGDIEGDLSAVGRRGTMQHGKLSRVPQFGEEFRICLDEPGLTSEALLESAGEVPVVGPEVQDDGAAVNRPGKKVMATHFDKWRLGRWMHLVSGRDPQNDDCSKEIGRALGISHRTVEIYRVKLMRKYQAGSAADLIQKLLRG